MMSSPPTDALRHALAQLARGAALSEGEARRAFERIISGSALDSEMAELLLALRARGETASELAGAVTAMRGAMVRVAHPMPATLVDTCGTGGGAVRTLNVSTAAAFVAAGAGVPVAKHGNRSFTSRSGSADVLEALGINIGLAPERAAAILGSVGLVFLFAPTYHPAMRHVAPVRKQLGVPTIMNLVGPLANPAGAGRQVVGVAEASRGSLVAEALLRLESTHALVVHADLGLDEISPLGTTRVWEVRNGAVMEWVIDPVEWELDTPTLDGLEGGEPAENAERISRLFLAPTEAPAALRAAVLLNAAAALYVGGASDSMAGAVMRARAALDGGAAQDRLEALRAASTAE